MARMPLSDKLDVIRQLHEVHERSDVGEDEYDLIQLQHDIEELLARAAIFLAPQR